MNSEQLTRLGMLSVDEVREIKRAVTDIHDVDRPVAVNIGAGVGTSTLAMLEASPDLFIFEVDKKLQPRAIVAVDRMGAAEGQLVLIVQGSSARMVEGCNKMPVDGVVVGLVDSATVTGKKINLGKKPGA